MHHNYQAIVNMFGGQGPLCIAFDGDRQYCIQDLKNRLYDLTTIHIEDQRITTMGGRPLEDDQSVFPDNNGPIVYNLSLRLRGGKGGFGSMLRSMGGRMNAQKTTDFGACRDLHGRRIRAVEEAKRLEEELAKIPEREKAKREKLEKKISEALRERDEPVYRFDDNQFLEDKEQVVESVKNAVSHAVKRQKVTKKAAASVFDDSEEESDEDDEQDENTFVPAQEDTTANKKKDKGKGRAVEPTQTAQKRKKATN